MAYMTPMGGIPPECSTDIGLLKGIDLFAIDAKVIYKAGKLEAEIAAISILSGHRQEPRNAHTRPQYLH
jgi:hypothetical protein